LKNQEFELHYQPQFDIKSGRIIGIEALLRLSSSMLGNVPPGQFIPLAEESGLIIPIGEWVLREACRQNSEWQQQGLPCLPVAINISAVQFRQTNLLEVVRSALQNSALAPEYLEIELTESIIMQNAESTIDCLRNLKGIGIKLSIDDFGTGYPSLCYLKRFRIDKLKIDQSFIRDIPNDREDEAIVKAIISLGHALNLEVIAEGVETQAQASFLATHLCDQVQGYLYNKPMPSAGITELLKNLTTKDKLS
jgi:EAL domain-containing protein (putative c-di-GMP-specific phosphodiesterase class I)